MRAAANCVLICLVVAIVAPPGVALGADAEPLPRQAAEALRRATDFFTTQVATQGGYLWRYSKDLRTREGEGKATDSMVWVQPPGTPSVGMLYLEAYQATGDAVYLEAARRAGSCLVRGQLRSGGWSYLIEFDPKRRAKYAYRADDPGEGQTQRNTSTLDDNTTQAALRLSSSPKPIESLLSPATNAHPRTQFASRLVCHGWSRSSEL